MNIEQGLKSWGLQEKEAKVYNALVQGIELTVHQLAQATKVPRTTIYDVVEELTNKGLISYSKKNGVKYYFAESPNRLLRILEEKMSVTKELLPLLFAAPSRESKPTTKLYLGTDGKKKVLDDILDTCQKANQKEFYVIPGLELYEELPSYMKKWIKQKEAMGLYSLVITADNKDHIAPPMYQNSIYRETRLIPEEYASITGINIYPGKVAVYSKIGNIEHSLIIESPSIYDTFKRIFMFMWKNAAKSVNKT